MINRFRQFAFIFLAFVLSLTLFSGCSSKDEADKVSSDDGKLSIKILSSIYNEPFDMKSDFWTKLEEKTGAHLDIEWVPINDYMTRVNLALASGNVPEVMIISETDKPNIVDAVNKGFFWDLGPFLDDFSEYPNLKNNLPESAWKYSKINDKNYYIPRTRPQISNVELVRQDWLEKVGHPSPKTLDELHEALKLIVEGDLDKNGQKDTIGVNFDDDAWYGAFSGFEPQYTPDNGIYPKYLTDGYTDLVEWYRNAYADGLMSKEFETIQTTQLIDLFKGGITAHFSKNPWHQYGYVTELQKVQKGAKVEIIPYFEGPKGNTARLTPGFFGGIFIPKNVPEKKVKQILKFYDKVASEEISTILRYGFEGTHYTVENGTITPTDQGKKEVNNSTIEPFATKFDPWLKTDSPIAPKEVNLQNREKVKPQLEVGKVDPYAVIKSVTWSDQWPKHEQEFISMRTKAISGKISMNKYKKYIEQLRDKKEFQPVYEELAENYKQLF
jgi:putative aldouronate transport system substrate-binding protein